MSTPTSQIQYVYIPNLVGKQMLRVPILPCDDITTAIHTTHGLTLKTTTSQANLPLTPPRSRETSPTVSIASVSDDE